MKVPCINCGGEVAVEQESPVVSCPYCSSRLFVDLGKSVLHYRMEPALDAKRARESVSTALERLELPRQHRLLDAELLYLPYWSSRKRAQSASGTSTPPATGATAKTSSRLRSAAAAPSASLVSPPCPSGDLKFFDAETLPREQVVLPELHLMTDAAGAARGDEKPMLLHLPFFRMRYEYGGKRYEAHVDGVSGRICADEWPQTTLDRAHEIYRFLALGAAVTFLAEGCLIVSPAAAALAILVTCLPFMLLAGRLQSGRKS